MDENLQSVPILRLKLTGSIISTNDMYVPTRNSKKGAYLRKSGLLLEMQEDFDHQLSQYKDSIRKFRSQCEEYIPGARGYKFSLIIGMPTQVYHYIKKSLADDLRPMDTSNHIKSIEDCISKALGIDDKYNIIVEAGRYDAGTDDWINEVIITPVEIKSISYDYLVRRFTS